MWDSVVLFWFKIHINDFHLNLHADVVTVQDKKNPIILNYELIRQGGVLSVLNILHGLFISHWVLKSPLTGHCCIWETFQWRCIMRQDTAPSHCICWYVSSSISPSTKLHESETFHEKMLSFLLFPTLSYSFLLFPLFPTLSYSFLLFRTLSYSFLLFPILSDSFRLFPTIS